MPRSGSIIPTFFLGQSRSNRCSFQSSLFQEKMRVIQKSVDVICRLLSELNPTSHSDPRQCCVHSLFFVWLHFLFLLFFSPVHPYPTSFVLAALAAFQPCLTYSWLRTFAVTIKKAECQIIDAFKLWCWRRLLRVSWTAKRSSQSILKEISPGCSLEGLMLKLKLQ